MNLLVVLRKNKGQPSEPGTVAVRNVLLLVPTVPILFKGTIVSFWRSPGPDPRDPFIFVSWIQLPSVILGWTRIRIKRMQIRNTGLLTYWYLIFWPDIGQLYQMIVCEDQRRRMQDSVGNGFWTKKSVGILSEIYSVTTYMYNFYKHYRGSFTRHYI